MSSSFGTHLHYTLFGESHGQAIGITVQGLPSGFSFDFTKIETALMLRSGKAKFNTPRQEQHQYQILSGYFDNHTTGTPFTVIFPNNDIKSKDYDTVRTHPRPSHADYTAQLKYGCNDYRGGGHFSGRLTTPLVFLGAMVLQLIQAEYPTFSIHSHIHKMLDITDTSYYDLRTHSIQDAFGYTNHKKMDAAFLMDTIENDEIFTRYQEGLQEIQKRFTSLDPAFPVIDETSKMAMQRCIADIQKQQATVGGNIETVVFNPPIALGDPFFNSVESLLSALLFSIGSVKAVHFGYGDNFIQANGADVKDEIIQINEQKVCTLYNYNGGINGGITNGEDLIIATTFKPISSLQQTQYSFNTATQKIEALDINGRHDVTIANRIIPVIEAMVLIGIYDLLLANK